MDSRMYVDAIEREGREIYDRYKKYRVDLPLQQRGPWRIRQFETEMGIAYLRHCRDGRASGIGWHTALSHDTRGIVMSDTAPEINDLIPHLRDLTGDVLVTGLGLGMVVHILTTIPQYSSKVRSITVVEVDRDVHSMVAPVYQERDSRVRIVRADARKWVPNHKFDAAWHDIWDEICGDNAEAMDQIKDHYGPHMKKRAKQQCWGEELMNERC